jgi:hypothetical protein
MKKYLRFFLKMTGAVLILVGLLGAYYGPLEIFVFYLFSKGGRFYYDGFGVGSLWFAALVVQNSGYYLVAAICIPLGVGHLKLSRWALRLTQLYLWYWLGAGVLLIANLSMLVPAAFNLDLTPEIVILRLTIVAASALLVLVITPLLALWFYSRPVVRKVFEHPGAERTWFDPYPMPVLALLVLFALLIIVLHYAIFFQAVFPLFGRLMLGRPSVYLIALCILVAGMLMYGLSQFKRWAWWGALVYLGGLSASTILTFTRLRFYDIILQMDLPAYEMAFIDQMNLVRDFRPVLLLSAPLLVGIGLVLYSRRYFG